MKKLITENNVRFMTERKANLLIIIKRSDYFSFQPPDAASVYNNASWRLLQVILVNEMKLLDHTSGALLHLRSHLELHETKGQHHIHCHTTIILSHASRSTPTNSLKVRESNQVSP
jgi:hypothetical protein